jgi:hypothetical protein
MSGHIWEKQDFESSKQYKAFCIYRNMGTSRSLAKAAAKINTNKYYVKMLEQWSAKNKWVMRCEQYDVYMEEERQKRMEQAYKETPVQHLDITKGVLTMLVDQFNRKMESGEWDSLEPDDLLKRMIDILKYERTNIGLPDARVEIKQHVTGQVQSNVSNDELLKNPLIAELVCAVTDMKEMGTTDLSVKQKKEVEETEKAPAETKPAETTEKKNDDNEQGAAAPAQ